MVEVMKGIEQPFIQEIPQRVGNKAKGRISKESVSRKQSRPIFPENKRLLPPDTHAYVCVSSGKKCSFLGKIGVLCLLETPILRFALSYYYLNDLCIWQCNPAPGFTVAKLFVTNRNE